MMESNLVRQFTFSFKEILIDEIALEGLEGIRISLLWRRVEKRMSSQITDKMRAHFFGYILYCDAITLFEIPEPLSYVEIKDRFEMIDEETGNIVDPPDFLDGSYTYNPVSSDYGSSIHYKLRKNISKDQLKGLQYENVFNIYGDKLIMVASLEERWKALAPHMPMTYLLEMTKTNYCLLELIGKARENGQMTVGNTNLFKIVKEPKIMFYNRKFLQDLDLIRVQSVPLVTGGRSVKGLLLRLKRFHQPLLLSMPKKGKVHDVVQYLLKQPDYSDSCKNMIEIGLTSHTLCKKLYKCENAFIFENMPNTAKKRFKHMTDRSIRLDPPSEDSSHSESETNEEQLKCQYHVKVNLLRQAYEKILESGLKGLTQVEIAETLGIEYYTTRTICRTFKSKNIVKEIFVDKGKQRVARFVASASAGAVSAEYEEEKKKFIQLLHENKNATVSSTTMVQSNKSKNHDSDSDVPHKKLKLSKNSEAVEDTLPDSTVIEKAVTEIKCLDGLEKLEQEPFMGRRKAPTMRQLKFANGIIKTIKEKVLISGYMNLNTLAAKESNEVPMDSKCLKTIVQKLVAEGHIKLLKMTWPHWHKSWILLCAPHVQITDPIVKAKYKEICLSVLRNTKVAKVKKSAKEIESVTRPLAMAIYPRYLKLQKLHEFLIKLVYFREDETCHTIAPEGFSSLVDMIPEFTVEYVLGNMNTAALLAMFHVNIPQTMLQQKLRNVPGNLFKSFLATPTLQNAWRQNLKVLSTLGLVQLIKNPTTSDDSYVLSYEFYVNRRASIIDTTGEWPRRDVDIESLRKSYYFETFEDVERYWKDVHDISINTKVVMDSNERSRKQPFYVPRLKEEVLINDNGQVYGNGSGPCGFDASFFMEMPKLWAMCHTKLKHHAIIKKPTIKMPKRKLPVKPKIPKVITRRKKRVEKPRAPGDKKKKRNRPQTSSFPKNWSKEEDKILMLCKAAITIISPIAHSGCLRLRNMVAKDILSLFDPKKSASACHKRAVALETNTALAYEKDCVINDLRRYPLILRRYEGIFKTLRLQYSGNITKAIVAARLPMLELVHVLLELIRSDTFNKKVPCVALNLQDFHDNYTICPSTVNRNYNSYKTDVDSGPVIAAIKEGIINAVMTMYRIPQSPETAKKIHSMFSVYPEQTLRPAIEQLRRAGAVAIREKTMTSAIHKFHFQDIAQSFYKLSSSYQRHWICRMNAEFSDNLMFSLDEELRSDDLKGNPEMNCLLFEAQASGVADVDCVTAPAVTSGGAGGLGGGGSGAGAVLHDDQPSVTDMMNYKIKAGTFTWKYKKNMNKFAELYQDTNYEAALKCLLRDSQLHIPPENTEIVVDDNIVQHLNKKKRAGSTLNELQSATGYDKETLISKLKSLESQNIAKRIGYFENMIVLTKFAKPWTITIKDKQVIPTPWLTMDIDFRNDVFLKWAGVIVNKVFLKPGCSISHIADECELLSTRAAQDICMVLEKCECVILKCIYVPEPDLFSEDVIPHLENFNEYESVENMFVFPVKDMLSRYSYVRKRMFDDEYYFEKT